MIKSIFFGTTGLTSTSANTVANWAKEYVAKTPSISFVGESIKVIGSNDQTIIKKGDTEIDTEYLKTKAKAYSLIAWLREAIKTREELASSIMRLTIEDYCKLKGIEEPIAPVADTPLTEKEYWDAQPLKERNRYYELEAELSVLGKFIHPNGDFAEARKYLNECLKHPISVSENGRDTIIHYYQPTVDPAKVEEVFFELQKKHRELQSQFNKLKYECEKAVSESSDASLIKYNKEFEAYKNEREKLMNELNKYKFDQKAELMKLKIVIPDSLQEIYQIITNLGNSKA